jgi:hypothetical protein
MFYAVQVPASTRAFSPRQLPTDHVHAVPTREYQSDQSSRQLLRCDRLCCPNPRCSKLTNGNRVPATPPVKDIPNARTVLARQGSASPRQPAARPCLLRAVPARHNTRRAAPAGTLSRSPAWVKKERPASLLTEESRPEFRRLTISLSYSY